MKLQVSDAHLSPVWKRHFDILAERGSGPYLYAADGRKFLDFTSGIGVTNTGHCHPKVVEAIRGQAEKLLHGQANIVKHIPMLALAERLADVVPEGLDSFFFANSGAEAVEAAIKLARQSTGKSAVVAFHGGFHGRTAGTMSLSSSKALYRSGNPPFVSATHFVPYPYLFRQPWISGQTPQERARNCVGWCLERLHELFASMIAPDEVAAILVEPVLGEGGYVVPPAEFLPALRSLCNEHGILLVTDEVQTGFGRTGRWFAVEHSGVRPDILVMAKGIASGLPLSGIAASPSLMGAWSPGSHGGTYGGNALACAAALATIEVIQEENLLLNSQDMGAFLISGLEELGTRHPAVGDVRGLGLMVAMELIEPDGSPASDLARRVVAESYGRGLLLLTCGPQDNVVRFVPPLIVTQDQVQWALGTYGAALEQALEE